MEKRERSENGKSFEDASPPLPAKEESYLPSGGHKTLDESQQTGPRAAQGPGAVALAFRPPLPMRVPIRPLSRALFVQTLAPRREPSLRATHTLRFSSAAAFVAAVHFKTRFNEGLVMGVREGMED